MKHNFGITLIPDNDTQRVQKIKEYDILDSRTEGPFDYLTALAVHLFNVPIALISLVDQDRVWFKANIGMDGVQEVPRGDSLCSLAILKSETTVFVNALEEPCLLASPVVAGKFGLRFYAGHPLVTHDGFHIGTFCIVDKVPRPFTPDDEQVLKHLASLVMAKLEDRRFQIKNISGKG